MKNSKRILAVLLTVVMVLSMVPVVGIVVSAETLTIEGLNGTGTETDPIQITSESDWLTFATYSTANQIGDFKVVLTKNLDFSNFDANGETEGLGHEALIASRENTKGFSGVFDGQNYTMSGISFSANKASVGIFGVIQGATIRNITLTNSSMASTKGGSYVAGIVGRVRGKDSDATDGSEATLVENLIENCVVTDTVSLGGTGDSGHRIGGIVGDAAQGTGYRRTDLTIRNCESHATITATSGSNMYYGGIIGISSGAKNATANKNAYVTLTVENCVATGSITITAYTAEKLQIGGIAGYVNGYMVKDGVQVSNATMSNCYADMDINVTLAADEDTTGENFGIGGIAGQVGNSVAGIATIRNCHADMKLTTTGGKITSAVVGNIVGNTCSGQTLTIADCTYTASTADLPVAGDIISATATVTATEIAYIPYAYGNTNLWTDANASAVVEKLINYGKYALDYFNGQTMTDVTGVDWSAYNNAVVADGENLTYVGSSLVLDTCVTLRHYFKLNSGKTAPATLNVAGTNVTVECKDNKWYYVDVQVDASALATQQAVKDGTATILTYSVYNYCAKAAADGDTKTLNVVNALYNYAQAAAAYVK